MQIYFVPDPSLSAVPFGALKFKGKYLIEKAAVAQASSLQSLDRAREQWQAICNGAAPLSEVGSEHMWKVNKA